MECFEGHVYIFVPMYFSSHKELEHFLKNQAVEAETSDSDQRSYGQKYVDCIESWYHTEVSRDLQTSLIRRNLGEYSIILADGVEQFDYENLRAPSDITITIHPKSLLAVLTICVHELTQPVTGLLDRVSSESLSLYEQGKGKVDLEALFLKEYGLTKASVARVLVSTRKQPSKELLPYLFANETFNSDNMSAKLRSSNFEPYYSDNIAQYDSSKTYIGNTTILRIDQRVGDDTDFVGEYFPTLKSDAALMFIAELVVLRDAAISRTNRRVLSGLSSEKGIDYNDMESINRELGKTISFWSLEIFKYITAQRLADTINNRFGIDKKFDFYREHQYFLQSKVNVRRGIIQERENATLYMIAIILFVVETVPVLYNVISHGLWRGISQESIIAALSSLSISGSILLVIIILIRRNRRSKLISDD